MFGVAAELEDIPLRDAHVLEQLPDGIRQAGGFRAAKLGGQISDRAIEFDVGMAASQ